MKQNLSNTDNWIRLLFVILFAFIFYIAGLVISLVVILQFGFVLLSGQRNANLQRFGGQMASYMSDILAYATFNRNDAPFPFSDWQNRGGDDAASSDAASDAPAEDVSPAAEEPAPAPPKKKTTRKKTTRKTVQKKTSKKTSKKS